MNNAREKWIRRIPIMIKAIAEVGLASVNILILGAGWTSTFLIPLCKARSPSYGAATRTGRDGTIISTIDPDSEDLEPYRPLPDAKTVLITFPITEPGAAARLVKLYLSSRSGNTGPGFIELGSTGIWDGGRTLMGTITNDRPNWLL
ncbi:hypothetical protein H0H93_002986 [Arthromyces matolae]|nr:hypothetical protein H0H93_002986 [Arthromyces matolae]